MIKQIGNKLRNQINANAGVIIVIVAVTVAFTNLSLYFERYEVNKTINDLNTLQIVKICQDLQVMGVQMSEGTDGLE